MNFKKWIKLRENSTQPSSLNIKANLHAIFLKYPEENLQFLRQIADRGDRNAKELVSYLDNDSLPNSSPSPDDNEDRVYNNMADVSY